MNLQILYEDNHLIAVYKPAGVLVQADDTKDSTLLDEVKYYLKTKYHKLGNVFLGVIHRLDRPVQGIILFAKTSKGASRVSEQFRNHTVTKIYHAIVFGKPATKKGDLLHYLRKDENRNKVALSETPLPDFLEARLSYEVVQTKGKYSLLKIKLGTGRPHQIRAQLSAIGCPIVGDVKYGAPGPLPDASLALAATTLSFFTATTEEEQTITIPLPETWKTYVSN